MTQDQINQLAREYAEYVVKESQDIDIQQASYFEAKRVIDWLLLDHLIVEKSKVQKIYDSNKSDEEVFRRAANSCCEECRATYESLVESSLHAIYILTHLFPETFNQDEQ